MELSFVLVTGATGFIGAHVVDNLLKRGFRVRGTARSSIKADQMLAARPEYASALEFVHIDDLATPGVFNVAIEGVDAVIHVASPLNYSVADKEKELIIPAIDGVRSILQAASKSKVKRVVLTSSFGAVLNMTRDSQQPWKYSAEDWNPITYAEAADPSATPQDAYRGSKKFAEQEAWRFMQEEQPSFDLVTLSPSMVFGPVVHPVSSTELLNESNKLLWKVKSGIGPLPPARFNFWIDVRDLAEAHVQALLTSKAGGKRYLPVASEKFSYQIASEIMQEFFPDSVGTITKGLQLVNEAVEMDGESVASDLGIKYRTFKETVVDFITQALAL